MSRIRESQEAIDKLRTAAREFCSFEDGQVRRDDFGTLKFVQAHEDWMATKEYLEPLLQIPLDRLPQNTIGELSQSLSNAVQSLRLLKQLPPNVHNSINEGQNIARNLGDQCREVVRNCAKIGGAILMQPQFFTSSLTAQFDSRWIQVEHQKASFEEWRKSAEQSAAKQQEQSVAMLEEVKALNQKARDLISSVGFAKEAKYFEEEARWNRGAGWGWLACVVLIVAGIVIYALQFVEPDLKSLPVNASAGDVARHAIPRLIFFATAYAALVWAVRNYSACRHNFVVNRHRANALSTFQAFSAATTDQSVRNAILVQATSAIFAAQSSGFLKDEAPPQEGSKIIEIFKDIAKPDAK